MKIKHSDFADDVLVPLFGLVIFAPWIFATFAAILLSVPFGKARSNEFLVPIWIFVSILILAIIILIHLIEFLDYRKIAKKRYVMEGLAERHKDKDGFPVRVNYDNLPLTFRTMMSGRWNPHFVNEPKTIGKEKIEIQLKSLPGVTTSREALEMLQKLGLRPAEVRELEAFRRRHGYANCHNDIVFLGAIYMSDGEGGIPAAKGLLSHMVSGVARVPYIPKGNFQKDRPFSLNYYDNSPGMSFSFPWNEDTKFAVVKS